MQKTSKDGLPLPVINLDKASVCGDRKTSFSFWQKRKIGIHIYREFQSVGRDSYLGGSTSIGPDNIGSDHMYGSSCARPKMVPVHQQIWPPAAIFDFHLYHISPETTGGILLKPCI